MIELVLNLVCRLNKFHFHSVKGGALQVTAQTCLCFNWLKVSDWIHYYMVWYFFFHISSVTYFSLKPFQRFLFPYMHENSISRIPWKQAKMCNIFVFLTDLNIYSDSKISSITCNCSYTHRTHRQEIMDLLQIINEQVLFDSVIGVAAAASLMQLRETPAVWCLFVVEMLTAQYQEMNSVHQRMGLIQYMAATTRALVNRTFIPGNTAHLIETLVNWAVKDRNKWTEIKSSLPKCHFIYWSPYNEFVKLRKSIFDSASLSQVSLTHTFNTFPHKRAAHLFPSWSSCLTLWGIHGKRVIWTIKSSLTEQVGGRYASKVTGHWRPGHIISPGAVHAICTINNNIQNHRGKPLVWDSSRA